uniref:BTB domain-containing protein n=1 Tax=Panagrolaimus sp. PS1159 TaxID=55785 RepID=A0AC35GMZ6_9BILA
MASNTSSTMFEYPINLEWTIAEDRLKSVKNSAKNEYLESEKFIAIYSSGVKYFVRIYPNGNTIAQGGKTWVFLCLELGNEKKVYAEYTFSIKSAEWNHKIYFTFEKSYGWGITCFTVDELFDSDMKLFVNGKLTLKVEGTLFIEKADSKWKRKILQPKQTKTQGLRDLWNTDFKDFTIVVGKKEIEVHKCVLACQSPVFAAMLKPHTKEAIENKVVISDFTFEVVEKGIKLCYTQLHVSDCSVKENLLLLKFTDKYDIKVVKENLEEYLGDQIAVENVCEISKCSGETNVLKLQNKCLDFLALFLSKKEDIPNMEILEKTVLIAAFKKLSCYKCQTL